jgi:hypothetical protein
MLDLSLHSSWTWVAPWGNDLPDRFAKTALVPLNNE